MINWIIASDHRGLNKGQGSKLRVGYQVQLEMPEDIRRTYHPKRREYNNKDEDCCPKTPNDKNRILLLRLFF